MSLSATDMLRASSVASRYVPIAALLQGKPRASEAALRGRSLPKDTQV